MAFVKDLDEYTISVYERKTSEENPAIACLWFWNKKGEVIKRLAYLFICSVEEIAEEIEILCAKSDLSNVKSEDILSLAKEVAEWIRTSPFYGKVVVDITAPNYLQRGFMMGYTGWI